MPEQPLSEVPADKPVRTCLQELAQFLRKAQNLSPEVRQTLADLVTELGQDLNPDTLPAAEKAHLAETIAQLTKALQERRSPGPIQAARDRLEQAIVKAENEAPVATGFLERLLDALSNLGI